MPLLELSALTGLTLIQPQITKPEIWELLAFCLTQLDRLALVYRCARRSAAGCGGWPCATRGCGSCSSVVVVSTLARPPRPTHLLNMHDRGVCTHWRAANAARARLLAPCFVLLALFGGPFAVCRACRSSCARPDCTRHGWGGLPVKSITVRATKWQGTHEMQVHPATVSALASGADSLTELHLEGRNSGQTCKIQVTHQQLGDMLTQLTGAHVPVHRPLLFVWSSSRVDEQCGVLLSCICGCGCFIPRV